MGKANSVVHKALKIVSYIIIALLLLLIISSIFNGMDEGVSFIISAIFAAYPFAIYVTWRFIVEKSLKNRSERYKFSKVQKGLLFVLVPIIFIIGIMVAPSYSRITGIEITSIEKNDFNNYNEQADNYSAADVNITLETDGNGEYYFDNGVKIRSLSDKNHPFNKDGGKYFGISPYDGKSDLDKIAATLNGNYIIKTDKLTNGKYELEMVTYKTNVEDKSKKEKLKKAVTIKKEFTVNNTYNSKETFLTEYNEYLAAMDKAQKEELERRKNEGVLIGMTEKEVELSSWGKPDKINKTTNLYGVHEQWVYRTKSSGYLYFDDGILTGIQTSQ